MSERIKITAVNPALLGAPIYKGEENGTAKFCLDVSYTLENGKTEPDTIKCRKKKDVYPALDSAKDAAQRGALSASIGLDGKVYGTVRRYAI